MNAIPEMTDVFQFMELRTPFSPEVKSLCQNYIYDDFIHHNKNDQPDRIDTDLQSVASPSVIGRLVYEQVFCEGDKGTPEEKFNRLVEMMVLWRILKPYAPPCPTPLTHMPHSPVEVEPLSITELERHAYLSTGGVYFLLPERLDQIKGLALFPGLLHALAAMERARIDFDLSRLVTELETVFSKQPLRELVFENGIYTEEFRSAKRTLFDTLYLLYIMRRVVSVNLEYVIEGLRALHMLEALSIDSVIEAKRGGLLSKKDKLLKTLETIFPELQGWNGVDELPTLPLIQTKADFEAYLRATPVVHPIFARLHYYKHSFNDLKPIGIGDLKVVKQWLVAYLPGEIAHIENVLKGEVKDRTHRRLEKTEEAFSFSRDYKEESQKDTQTTERFELKREIENIVKTELNVGANATFDYNNKTIHVTVSGNFSYKRDATERDKTNQEFWRETMTKAMGRIEQKITEQRSVTKLFETEETNRHVFDNKGGPGHITGIYRWLDKKYKAQLFNFGKRMMFEFVIPEPAAFFVESRLRAFETTLDCPQPPNEPELKTVLLGFNPADIIKERFEILRQKYDLAEFTFPEESKTVPCINQETGQNYFAERPQQHDTFYAKTYTCQHNAKGYEIEKLVVTGRLYFGGPGESGSHQRNRFDLFVNSIWVDHVTDEDHVLWTWGGGTGDSAKDFYPQYPPILLTDDSILVGLTFWDIEDYHLAIIAHLKRSNQYLLEWQTQVYKKIVAIEQKKVDIVNQENILKYNSQMSEYRNRLAELKATTVNDLLQGQSEAFNRAIIRTELKKHCLTLLTKEFDAESSDDLLAKSEFTALSERSDGFAHRRFKVDETTGKTTCAFVEVTEERVYPAINLEGAKRRGRLIQFLEQAFEWQHLAYICYPYFWADRPKWIEMMNRSDEIDPNMTAFLQAGSAKALLAVTPAYEDAVLHFLATREPWEGGPAPVIGDPLFIPLYEELRKQQDDRYHAVPEGTPWTFTLPTSLVYLEDGGATLPTFPDLPTP